MSDGSPNRFATQDELTAMSDQELADYVTYWRERGDAYREARRMLPKEHPDAYRTGYSGWWCSKFESSGRREQQRRDMRGLTVDSPRGRTGDGRGGDLDSPG